MWARAEFEPGSARLGSYFYEPGQLVTMSTMYGTCTLLYITNHQLLHNFREKLLQNITNYFIVSLAVADLFVASIVMPFSVYVLVSYPWLIAAVKRKRFEHHKRSLVILLSVVVSTYFVYCVSMTLVKQVFLFPFTLFTPPVLFLRISLFVQTSGK